MFGTIRQTCVARAEPQAKPGAIYDRGVAPGIPRIKSGVSPGYG